jgi:cytochrome c-type biogenesis protein CcsB
MDFLSDLLLQVTIVVYLAVMVCYAVEYAFATGGVVTRVAERELVAAGGVDSASPPLLAPVASPLASPPASPLSSPAAPLLAPVAPPATPPSFAPDVPLAAGPSWPNRAGLAGTALGVLAIVLHASTLVTRALAAHRVPWGNMYEFVIAGCFVGVVAWAVVVFRRPQARHLGLFVAFAELTLLGTALMVLHTKAGPLVPALNSYWLKIHVSAAVTASGILLVGFVLAALTLIRTGYQAGKVGFLYSLGNRLPAADGLERLTFRVHAFAFPIWTFAIVCGAIWAEAAWGRYWGWDPKETWSFIAWVVYACYLHARATPSVKRSTASWIAVAGWATMMVNLFGVNLVIAGLHSYAGVN